MVLAAHTVHAPAGLGIDEGTRPELVAFGGKNLNVTNMRQDLLGELTLRNGFAALTNARVDATTATTGYKMFADRESILRITETPALEAYSSAAACWSSLGRVPEASCRLIGVPSVGSLTSLEDVDATNGYLALSWLSTDALASTAADAYIAIVDQATGAVVRIPEKVGTSTSVSPAHLAVQGNYFITARYNTTGTKIVAHYLDTTSAATITTGWVAFGASLCADALGTTGYQAMGLQSLPSATTARVGLVYVNTSGGASQLTVKTFDVATGVLQTQTVNTGGVQPTACAIACYGTGTLWVSWNQATLVKVLGLDRNTITATALAATATILTMVTGVANNGILIAASATDGTKARVWSVDTNATLRSQMAGVKTTAATATIDAVAVTVPATVMVRKPFHYGGRYYSAFYGGESTQNNLIVCDWTDDVSFLRPIANPSPGLAPASLFLRGKFAVATTTSKLYVGMAVRRSGIADGSALALLDFADSRRWLSAAWGNSTYLSGGILSCFDGVRVAEAGFLIRPPLPAGTPSGVGTINATWRYIAVYEEVDGDGNWHQSGISSPSAVVTMVNNTTATVTTQPLTITSRTAATAASKSLRVAWYRTLTGGVAPYYRVGITTNDPSLTTVTLVDTTTDVVLAVNGKLYEQVGVNGTSQDKRPPPSFQCLTSYNGMLCGASGSDVWYSGQNVSGEGVWFNPIFQVPVPGDGDITAMWAMDGTLFVAKRREIYAISGEAPSDNGASGGLGLPRRLSVDVGCIEARSPCVTALGTFFQSDRGVEILTRSQSVEWIGQGIQVTLASFPVITSATVDPVSCTVIIEGVVGETSGLANGTGRAFVYDLSIRDWVSIDRRRSVIGFSDETSQSACMVNVGGSYRYAWLETGGRVHYETPTTFYEADGTFVVGSYETAWLKHGLQQQQRVWNGSLLFQRNTAAGLKVEVAYDYAAYDSANDKVWTEAETLSQRQLPYRPKSFGQAMKFRVSGTAPATVGTGQGMTFIGLSLDAAAKQGSTTGLKPLATAGRK